MSDGSRITVRLSDGIKPNSWSAGILEVNSAEKCAIVQLLSPPNGIVGKATLIIDTKITDKVTNGSNTTVTTTRSRSTHDDGDEEDKIQEKKEDELIDHVKAQRTDEQEEEEEEEETETENDAQELNKHLIVRYVHHQHVYFLFNCWNKGEQLLRISCAEIGKENLMTSRGTLSWGVQIARS
jgi:hypothetical protein